MFGYKKCKYYKEAEENEHCPFDCICTDDCIFTSLYYKQNYKVLEKEFDDLQEEVWHHDDIEVQFDNLQDEYNGLEQSHYDYKEQAEEYIHTLITELSKYQEVPQIEQWQDELVDLVIPIHEINKENKEMWSKCTDPISVKMVAQDKYKPSYANETDACMDLKARINVESKNRKFDDGLNINNYVDVEGKECWIFPGETRLLGTGLQVAVPKDHVMLVDVRSSTGAKLKIQLANTIGIIDTGYRDEVKVCCYNFGKEPVKVEDGQRLCQFFIIPRPPITPNFVEDNDEFRNGDRGGGFGSTGQ